MQNTRGFYILCDKPCIFLLADIVVHVKNLLNKLRKFKLKFGKKNFLYESAMNNDFSMNQFVLTDIQLH